jgi:hypothetical protein
VLTPEQKEAAQAALARGLIKERREGDVIRLETTLKGKLWLYQQRLRAWLAKRWQP